MSCRLCHGFKQTLSTLCPDNTFSVPYESILAFAVQSAGSTLDKDSELEVWSTGYPKVVINFSASNVDLFQIYQLLNVKVKFQAARGTGDEIDPTPPNMDQKQTGAGNMIDWLGDNAKQVDAKTVEAKLKTEFPVLLDDEKVLLAFQSGRDFKVFTDRRIFMMDVKGLVGECVCVWRFASKRERRSGGRCLVWLTQSCRHCFSICQERRLSSSRYPTGVFMALASKRLELCSTATRNSYCIPT